MTLIFEKAAGLLAVGVALSGCAAQLEDTAQDGVEGYAQALTSGPQLIATGVLTQTTDLAPFSELLENGKPQNVLGGIGSGLACGGRSDRCELFSGAGLAVRGGRERGELQVARSSW
jgi:hypothetical protein